MSGDGKILTSSAFNFRQDVTTVNYTMGGSGQWTSDTNILLYILLAVCSSILVLLLCLLLCFCYKFLRKSQGRKAKSTNSVKTVLISKSTSITGLNQGESPAKKRHDIYAAQTDVKHGQILQNRNFNNHAASSKDCTNATFAAHGKLMTSTPTVRENGSRKCNTIVALVTSPQSTITTSEWQSFKHETPYMKSVPTYHSPGNDTVTESYQALSPGSQQGVLSWATTNDILEANTPNSGNSGAAYGTAFSQLENNQISEENDMDSASEVKELLPAHEVVISCSESSDLLSPLTPNGFSSSLPVDVHGHPRAWFVPLDEIYHEPLRHSFIDVSNHNFTDEATSTEEIQPDKSLPSPEIVSSNPKINLRKTPSTGVAASHSSSSEVDRSESANWRDSGVPVSHINLRKSSSSECEGKKQSLWERLEDRPVVFLEDKIENIVSPS